MNFASIHNWDLIIEGLQDLQKNGERNVYCSALTLELLEKGFLLRDLNLQLQLDDSKESSIERPPSVEELQDVLKADGKKAQMDLLINRIQSCPVALSQLNANKHLVVGEGSLDADIFFCGEAPGADEETEGRPFVGPAGQLLTKMIQAMGLRREDTYIANILKWRPSMPTPFGNRPPTSQEMAFCLPYLKLQLQIIQPKVIVALGSTAMNGFLGADPQRKITQARGQWHSFQHIPLILTYHPSYLLRNATHSTKREAWVDLLSVMDRLNMPISDKQRSFFLRPSPEKH